MKGATIDSFLNAVLTEAILRLRADPVPIHTFAFYHDYESGAVSVCVDTKESSRQHLRQGNRWSMKHFAQHIQAGNWEQASLFQANIGRSLSLGDFARVNLARTLLPPNTVTDDTFYLAMLRAVIAHQQDILSHAPDREDILFCCSGTDAEVGMVWSALQDAEPKTEANALL